MKSDKSDPSPPVTPGTAYEVPVQGSLALLALGARGLEAWRAKRAEVAGEDAATVPSQAAPSDPDAPASDG